MSLVLGPVLRHVGDTTAAVWVQVEFTRSGPQTCPGFVEQADGDVVYVQLVHMGFVHHVWVPMDRLRKRALRPQGRR